MSSVFYDTFIWLLACLRKVSSLIWIFIWLYVIGIAVLIHLGFLVYWPDNFMHEDSQAYMAEAQSILTGHYADDPGRRPYGVAFFLFLLSKLFSPNIVVFVIAQHALSIASAILVAASVRFAGAPRIFSVLAFLLAALYARTVHYDNTVGAETISVFLMCVAMFIATGLAFRNWPPFISAVGIGLSLGPVMVCRSASVGAAAVILLWLLPLMKFGWPRRFGVVLLAGGISLAVYFVPAVINSIVGKHPAANETVAVMSFVVGYSGNFDSGVHLDRKAQARAFVNERRAAYGPTGWADGGEAQWPFQAIAMMGKPDDTEDDLNKFVRDIFLETVTTPSTLWHHLSVNFAREMYFLLFDGSRVAAFASNPQGYRYFVERDRLPFFKSPTGFKYRTLIFDHYHPNWWLLRLLPNPGELQAQIDSLMTLGYMPRTDLADLCCGLTISSEYDELPGPIRWLSAATLILLALLIVGEVAARLGWVGRLPRNLVAGGMLMILLAMINAAFPAFLVYGLNRYAYYVTPFMAGASALFGALLFEWVRLAAVSWRWHDRSMPVSAASTNRL